MQQLLLDKEDIKKIKQSVISIAGIGGIGSFAFEFLIRNGFQNFKIADLDTYDYSNIRQLFVTQETVGHKKIDVALKRALDINPKLNIETYKEGINVDNFKKFCLGSNVICAQTDRITSQLLLYLGAQVNKLPLLHAGRAKWPNKHLVTVSFYDYRNGGGIFNFSSLGINPIGWGVHNINQLEQFTKNILNGISCPQLINKIDNDNFEYKRKSFIEEIKQGDTSLISEKSRDYLLKIAKKFPNNFYKMAITPELCSVSGALITTAIKDILLDRSVNNMAIDLYNGKLFEKYKS